MEPARRSRFSGRTWRIAIPVGAFALGAVIGAAGAGSGSSTPAAPPQATDTVNVYETETATVTATPQPSAGQILLKKSGSGDWNSEPFQVAGSQLRVTYSYSGNDDSNFAADITDGSDDQLLVNTIGTSGGTTTSVYPTDPGQAYHLEVTASGSWTFTVTEIG